MGRGSVPDTDRGRRRALATVLAIVFIDLLGFGIVVPILPFYVRSFGVSDVFIGLLAAAYSLLQFGSTPALGRLSDERGRRPVLVLSLAGATLAWLVLALGGTVETAFGTAAGLATLFVARALAGAMGGNIAAAQAYVTDVTPAAERAGALGLVGAAFGLGFVFEPALGAVFASDPVVTAADRLLPAVVPVTAVSLPSFAAAGFSAVALVATVLVLPEPDRTRAAPGPRGLIAPFRTALADVTLRPLVGVFFVASLAFSGVQVAFIPCVADRFGYTASAAGLLLTYIGALGVLNQGVLVGWLSRRVRDTRLAAAGAGLLVGALATLPFATDHGACLPPWLSIFGEGPRLVVLLVVLAVLSLGNSLLNVGLAATVSRSASEATQGTAFGVTQGAGSLGRTIGPPLMTGLHVLAIAAPFLLGAGLTVGVLAALVGIDRARP